MMPYEVEFGRGRNITIYEHEWVERQVTTALNQNDEPSPNRYLTTIEMHA